MYTSHYPKEGPWALPDGWVWTSLGEIFHHNTGKALNASDHEGILLSYITTSNLYWDRFELSSVKEMHFTEEEIDKCTVKKGDLLVCEGGDIGRAAIWNQEYDIRIQNHIHRLRGFGSISQRLFMFWLMFMKIEGMIGGKGIGLMGLSSRELDKMMVPLPPINEEKRIVEKIDSLFNSVDALDYGKSSLSEQIFAAKAKIFDLAIQGKLVPQDPSDEPAIELLKRINPTFKAADNLHYEGDLPNGWELCHLDDVCDILDSQRKPINAEERAIRNTAVGTKYPYYGATGQVDTINDYLFDGDFILLGEDGAPFLEPHSPKAYSVSGKIWVNNHAHILSPKCNLKYLLYYLNSINYHPFVTGTTRLKLTQEAMKRITILLPPKLEQLRIISQIDAMFSVLNGITESIDAS